MTTPSPDEKERLAHFLRRRQLNERMVCLLKKAKEENGLKRGEITTSKSATYEDITEALHVCTMNGWLRVEEVADICAEAELAGRQHVLLFRVADPVKGLPEQLDDLTELLRTPETLNTEATRLEEFWRIPLEPYSRILRDGGGGFVMKVIAPRDYWISDDLERTADVVVTRKERKRERSAVIIKYQEDERLLQFRVPVRERAPNADTAKSVYDFVSEIIRSQFGDVGFKVFGGLPLFPISDAFPKLVNNKDDFEMHSDTPENQHFKSSMSHKGTPDTAADIRDFEHWNFAEGFARTRVKGAWRLPLAVEGEPVGVVHVRMMQDNVRLDDSRSRRVARVFFPRPCTDEEVEHVLRRIEQHR